jgi:hypothetical protein
MPLLQTWSNHGARDGNKAGRRVVELRIGFGHFAATAGDDANRATIRTFTTQRVALAAATESTTQELPPSIRP